MTPAAMVSVTIVMTAKGHRVRRIRGDRDA
jgi:hypothetical protein